MPQSRERFLRKTNLQHAMHNFYWYIIEYYFTSDPFSKRTANKRAQNVSGKNIYAVGIETVCIERYIGTFLYFFLFCFTILFLSTVGFCVVPTESGRQQQHRVYGRKYFLCWIWMYCEGIYIKAYTENSTNETNSDGRNRDFSMPHIDFCLARNASFASTSTSSGSMEKSNYSFFITVVFFLYFETYKNNIKHWFDSKSDCYCWIQKILEPKWWKIVVLRGRSSFGCMQFRRFWIRAFSFFLKTPQLPS